MMVILAMVSSLVFVFFNTFSFWMISSLISTIMNPGGNKIGIENTDLSINEKLESLVHQLIGSGSQLDQLEKLCLILVITFILKNLFFFINNILFSFVGTKLIMDIRNQLFSHLQKLPLSFFDKSKSGELSSIMMIDVSNMQATIVTSVHNLVTTPISIVFLLVMLFIINIKMTIYVLLVIPFAAYIISILGGSVRRKSTRSSIQIAGLMNVFQETMTGIRIVKAFIMEKFEIKRFAKENYKYFKLNFRLAKLSTLITPISDMIGISMGVLLLWIGGREVILHGNLDPDDFIRYIIYLFAMLQPARTLGGINAQIQSGLASSKRVFSIIDIKSNITDPDNPVLLNEFKHQIRFNNVSFQYENTTQSVLNDISVQIPKGKTLALVGSSGSGKSTFADLIPRFYDVSNGSIAIDDVDIRDIELIKLRKIMGIVTQDTILFNDTISNNICYGKRDTDIDKIRLAAEAANALEFIEALPLGFDTIIGEKGIRLSGGQKQRISIARAILKNPEILILDEATSALDTESERKVQGAIDHLVKNRTVIVIAHRLSTIVNADQIIVLDAGKLVESGTHTELLSLNGTYKKLYDIQFGETAVK